MRHSKPLAWFELEAMEPRELLSNTGFVTRAPDGWQLMLNGQVYRSTGANTQKGYLRYGGGSFASNYEVDDVFATLQEMGMNTLREYTPMTVGRANSIEPQLGVFNEEALQRLDYLLKSANDHDIRLIIPLLEGDDGYWTGGIPVWNAWHGLTNRSQFFTDTATQNDFRQFISTIINRVNTLTGVAYKDDPTILAWETGNELNWAGSVPSSWTAGIAAYIKGLDPNHLVIDGRSGSARGVANVDAITYHGSPSPSTAVSLKSNPPQVYLNGEFYWGWKSFGGNTAADLQTLLNNAVAEPAVSGVLLWEINGHTDAYGYIPQFSDAQALELYYPGRDNMPSYQVTDARAREQILRNFAYQMAGVATPAHAIPDAPLITSIAGNIIAWRGVAAADAYQVERSTVGPDGPWTIATTTATDWNTPWTDASQPTGGNLWYRVKGVNLDGVAGAYSPVFKVGSAYATTSSVSISSTGTGVNQFNFVGSGWTSVTSPYNARNTSTIDDYATIQFVGTQITLNSRCLRSGGYGAVSIDGGPETTVDFYSYYDLTNDTPSPFSGLSSSYVQSLWTSETLAYGLHTLKVRVVGQHGPSALGNGISLDSVTVTTPSAGTSALGQPLSRTGWTATASRNSSTAGNTLDGSNSSYWTSGRVQTVGDWYQVNFGSARTFSRIVFNSGTGNDSDYPRGYAIYVSSDGVNWGTPVASGTGTGPTVDVSFASQTKQYVRIQLTAADSYWWWSIGEVNAYNPLGGPGPRIVGVQLGSTAWPDGFEQELRDAGQGDLGYVLPAGSNQLQTLAWSNLNQIVVRFNVDVQVDKTDLQLTGTNTPSYDLSGASFNYDAYTYTATWTLAENLPAEKFTLTLNADGTNPIQAAGIRLDGEWTNPAGAGGTSSTFPSGDGTAGGNFAFRFNVLPGDANQDGSVDVVDLGLMATNYGAVSGTSWSKGDFNADGAIDVVDLGVMATNYGRNLLPVTGVVETAAATPTTGDVALAMTAVPIPAATVLSATVESQPTPALASIPATGIVDDTDAAAESLSVDVLSESNRVIIRMPAEDASDASVMESPVPSVL